MIVSKGCATVPIANNLANLKAVEVWDAVYGQRSNRKLGNLAPMHPASFAERRTAGLFKADATGRPFYYTRTADGIEFHPACDKDYWFRPVFKTS